MGELSTCNLYAVRHIFYVTMNLLLLYIMLAEYWVASENQRSSFCEPSRLEVIGNGRTDILLSRLNRNLKKCSNNEISIRLALQQYSRRFRCIAPFLWVMDLSSIFDKAEVGIKVHDNEIYFRSSEICEPWMICRKRVGKDWPVAAVSFLVIIKSTKKKINLMRHIEY